MDRPNLQPPLPHHPPPPPTPAPQPAGGNALAATDPALFLDDPDNENPDIHGPPVAPLPVDPVDPDSDSDTDSDPGTLDEPNDDVGFDHTLGDGTSHLPANRLHMSEFIMRAIPQFRKMQCRIFRYRDGVNKFAPGYEVFLEHGHQQIFLMAARKMNANTGQGSVYAVYDVPLIEAKPVNVVCKVRSNFLGTAFSVTAQLGSGDPVIPKEEDPVLGSSTVTDGQGAGGVKMGGGTWWQGKRKKKSKERKWHEELVAILYEPNILGFKGPRKMTILLPIMSPDGDRVRIVPKEESETLVERMKSDTDPLLLKLHNKSPQWNEETHSYVLNFNGRVTVASVKNFQVVHAHDLDYIIMQFGRADEGTFSMDAQYPLSPVQAFGICLSSFDAKLACE
ncbi:tubby C-terminal-like domain-containing protein [Catenaria anguillulae PL171]|uniref:Tubby C-terminal-like domain-containing protein n=1 Tax=Catenaria anguillulae PL171 TaxID=765915 RepID=A0A1Y2HIZ8_9FUNG|nr:tubby C-terminal-like domain-containing protein [Catenaria anguillulae PL171]